MKKLFFLIALAASALLVPTEAKARGRTVVVNTPGANVVVNRGLFRSNVTVVGTPSFSNRIIVAPTNAAFFAPAYFPGYAPGFSSSFSTFSSVGVGPVFVGFDAFGNPMFR